ncbi:hypothetical protein GDO78_016602 [Eleutherodactylus coqui]|uniref:Uncharacterized protein n=1 Tax=Eleutherodactylus coqui TaxID=57060 RepID=A0A8J6BRD5_ELECQ|nr:hypothetical protein GDO78_016602 [Eleutherodactylus coqui]
MTPSRCKRDHRPMGHSLQGHLDSRNLRPEISNRTLISTQAKFPDHRGLRSSAASAPTGGSGSAAVESSDSGPSSGKICRPLLRGFSE